MGIGKKIRWLLVVVLAAAGIVTACAFIFQDANSGEVEAYYISGSEENRENLRELFTLLAREDAPASDQFAVIREIAHTYARAKDYGRLIQFLASRTVRDPSDPYNSYYLLMTAYAYIQMDAAPVAARYFDLIVKNYPDLTVNGESIHLACLNQLIALSTRPEQQVWYYQELISRFPDKIDLGVTYFKLGQAYEQTGEWNSAIQAYTQYLPYTGTIIPGFPNADNYAKQQVDFSKSPKDWTFESLPALLQAVRSAIDGGSPTRLQRCQAKVNFFARSWEQQETDDSGMADFNLTDFMRGNRVRYNAALDESSNATEAYLRTSGWSQYISVWYLYFRKIYFPSNPEIHGRWEWAGVYYGEKF
ncbi:MAG TPA: tetratricopeptide repeat protein [Treponema sp.]|nr:tetratricopeptide repeat protein [Treponema sp.]